MKQANEYTDKTRPSGYYMLGNKRRYWSAENQKYYLDQIGTTDDTMARLGIPNPGAYLKGLIKGDPEKRRAAQLMIDIDERGGRGMQLPDDYGKDEAKYFKKPVSTTDPDTPSEPVVETTESEPVVASEVTKPPSQRELLIKEARTKYKDSPFKQWAHTNQKLAMALKPGQVGYAQVQEYFKEQKGKLKVKPQEKPFIKPNATKVQMGPGANDLRGYAGSTSPIA